jgi:hypothetical protein
MACADEPPADLFAPFLEGALFAFLPEVGIAVFSFGGVAEDVSRARAAARLADGRGLIRASPWA